MSLINSIWMDAGDGISFRYHRDVRRDVRDIKSFCGGIREYDMIEIKLLNPSDFPVAVDTGKGPYTIMQGLQSGAKLSAQVADLHRAKEMVQMRCDCYDGVNNEWYVAEITIDYSTTTPQTSLNLKASQPIGNFGAPAPNMAHAFDELNAKLHPPN